MIFSKFLGSETAKKILSGQMKNGRIANAYLFTGPDNTQKKEAAIEFIRALNCINGGCGNCLSCKKIGKNLHPDLMIVEPEKSSIKIEQIRALKKSTHYGPSEGNYLGVIVDRADLMTSDAINSFLKLLEEPAKNVTFILITSKEKSMPQTIVSRCQKIFFTGAKYELNEEYSWIFDELDNMKNKKSIDLLEFAQTMQQADNAGIERLLYSMVEHYKSKAAKSRTGKSCSNEIKSINIIMNAYRKLKRRGNVRLTLESMSLSLGEIYA